MCRIKITTQLKKETHQQLIKLFSIYNVTHKNKAIEIAINNEYNKYFKYNKEGDLNNELDIT